MKARDIIPGWPRGRSTSAPEKWHWIEWPWRIDEDDILNRNYHAQQQAMVTAYIERPLREAIAGMTPLSPTVREVIARTLKEQRQFEIDLDEMIRYKWLWQYTNH